VAIQFINRSVRLPSTADQIEARLTGGPDGWSMTDAERSALSILAQKLKPQCAIDIGVYRGGSLSILATHSEKVYALDIDPTCASHTSQFPNVEFIAGWSKDTLPLLLEKVQGEGVDLILIDADHSEHGVRADIELVLRYRPIRPLYIVMHDSFNPFCRLGIKTANWAANEHVHLVELDFVSGRFEAHGDKCYRQMWCGFGLAILLPEKRNGAVTIHENERLLFEAALSQSVHRVQWWDPAKAIPKIARGVRRRFASAFN
jgi:23S rRNA U2552 (ribose-2'-O)-methylase RlmE/FtsJ